MISEIKNSVITAFKERSSSPFWGAILISWFIWNWKLVFVTILFSSNDFANGKFLFVEANYMRDWDTLFKYPIISGLAFFLASPWISNISQWWSDIAFLAKNYLSNRIRSGHRLSETETKAYIAALAELEEENRTLAERFSSINLQNQGLRGNITDLARRLNNEQHFLNSLMGFYRDHEIVEFINTIGIKELLRLNDEQQGISRFLNANTRDKLYNMRVLESKNANKLNELGLQYLRLMEIWENQYRN